MIRLPPAAWSPAEPVVTLIYGDLGDYKDDLYQSLHIMGKVLGKTERAESEKASC